MASIKDLKSGDRFGRLTAVEYAKTINKRVHWLFECDCGARKTSRAQHVTSGRTKSCGCFKPEPYNRTHGMSDSRLYLTWLAMRRRCKDPKNEFYENYGGRGIKVCERWNESFQTFFDDMGLPEKGMTLERKDNNGDYSPENCRWATAKEQARNRRANRKITVKGQTLCVAEWAELSRISHSTIVSRLGRGWPEHLAVTVPPRNLQRSPESPQ